MKGRMLYAKPYAESKIEELKIRVEKLNKTPKLVVLNVEGDMASERYIRNKNRRCDEVGIKHETIVFPNNVSQEVVENKIKELNLDDSVTGVLLQLPLPKHLDEFYLTNLIDVEKDVDGFCIENTGLLALGRPNIISCTPRGCVDLLKYYGIELKGKTCLVINSSCIVGKPLANLLLIEKATPIVAHIHTQNLKEMIKQVDIIFTATGNLKFLHANDFLPNQIVVDIAINFNDETGKLEGDVDKSSYSLMEEKGIYYTPVPGSIGVMTVLSLITNIVEVAEKKERDN